MNDPHFDFGWVENGRGESHLEPVYMPDIASEIDGVEESTITEEQALTVMGKVMNQVLHFCFQKANGQPVNLPRAFRRFCMVTWALRPELFDNMSLSALSPHLHVSRASLSQIVRRFCDENGIRNILMKTESARESYSNAQKASHARRKKTKPSIPSETPGLDNEAKEENPHSEASE